LVQLDLLTIEVGSTITKANGYVRKGDVVAHVAQGFAPTTVLQGDVSIGVEQAIKAIRGYSADKAEIFVNSSAAGGLKMTVHGLTPSMTARAAKEASLGAGAIIKKHTAGEISKTDLDEIQSIRPNLVLLAGGVDFGERDIVLENARSLISLIVSAGLKAPLIYSGNCALQADIKAMAVAQGCELWIAENVFPEVDTLNVAPLRKLIHEAFARHIIHAPGMSKIAAYTSHPVLPTPGAVLLAAELFSEMAGDCVVVDVGGATTDVHSVTDGSPEFSPKLMDPEPRAKRTVEGDLGVFVNAESVLAFDDTGKWKNQAEHLKVIPLADNEKALTAWLCKTALTQAIKRHAGTIKELYTASGRKQIVQGKDLTSVKYVIGTGGALTKLAGGHKMLSHVCLGPTTHLFPPPSAKILLDSRYLMSSAGTFLHRYKEEASSVLAGLLGEDSVQ
jgi:uncharacterized protein (TIGR01319 family)